jgi:predicted DNA-binding transcriptional regulator YafY
MRASRLVSMLLLLQTRGQMTAAELARELEVSERTIYRDLEALSAAGVPVYGEPGRGGGCRLVDGYRTRLTGLTANEAETLFLAGVPGAVGELGLGTVLAAAQLKVLAALPPELRSRATRVQERFHLDAPGWFRTAEEMPHLAPLAEALWADERVEIVYQRSDKPVTRTLDPLGLVLKAGVWYLLGRHRSQVRTYRVARIQSLRRLSERFDRPLGFDLVQVWSGSSLSFEESVLRIEVTARVRAAALSRLSRNLEHFSARAALADPPPPDDDGWVVVRFPAESVEVAHHELLRFGADIVVLHPPELRERMRCTARALARQYADRGGA